MYLVLTASEFKEMGTRSLTHEKGMQVGRYSVHIDACRQVDVHVQL